MRITILAQNSGWRVVLWAMTLFAVLCVWGCAPREKGPPDNTLIVDSTPISGAGVEIAGMYRGETPLTVKGIEPGQVYVILTHEGYKRSWRQVTVSEAGEVRVTIEMQPRVAYLSFDSKPQLAEVYLDGRKLGETPLLNQQAGVGERVIEYRKENFQTIRETMTLQEDYRYNVMYELEPEPAQLEVFSRPTNAQVWLNDQLQEKITPARFSLPPGVYSVAVYVKGYVVTEETVQLTANSHRLLDLKLVAGEVPLGMVLVPAGEFLCGVDTASPDERPRRKVFVDAFYMDKFEVTNVQFKRVFPEYSYEEGRDNFPAQGVSFNQAAGYARALGKRLPTEYEWEKAARGVDGREYPWGNKWEPQNCDFASGPMPAPSEVGRYRAGASPYQCMDMAGNVYEWTSSWYQAYPGNQDIRIDYGMVFRVLRGGSYLSEPFDVRCARRHYDRPDAAQIDYGFRLAMDVPGPPGAGPKTLP